MKLIIGLGNPEEQHEHTRHNVGFRVIDALAKKLSIPFEPSEKLFSHIGKKGKIVLVKPQTYMNESGKAVQAVTRFFKIDPATILVVHDDLDIPLGTIKFQAGRGPKLHNGLLSIYQAVGTKEFWHLRIGTDGRSGKTTVLGKDYVLSPFTSEEEKIIKGVIDQAVEKLLAYTQE